MSITVTLPWPPSVNRMWRTPRSGPLAGRTMLSTEGREYRQAVADQVMVQHVPRHTLKGKLIVSIAAHPPDRRERDLDNLLKAILDGLKHAGVMKSDGDIDDLRILRGGLARPKGRIVVAITEFYPVGEDHA